jgi:hypothetical protein
MLVTPDGAATLQTQADRRKSRSADPLIALTRMLDAARAAGELDAIAVADLTGCLVAGSGAARTCDELAALAPLTASSDVLRVAVDGVDLLVAAAGGATLKAASLGRAAAGCQRILRENAAGWG